MQLAKVVVVFNSSQLTNLTLLHSEQPKLYVFVVLSAIGLKELWIHFRGSKCAIFMFVFPPSWVPFLKERICCPRLLSVRVDYFGRVFSSKQVTEFFSFIKMV